MFVLVAMNFKEVNQVVCKGSKPLFFCPEFAALYVSYFFQNKIYYDLSTIQKKRTSNLTVC